MVQKLNMTNRNVYLNGTYELATSRGFDILQLKLDGWHCTTRVDSGQAVYYSETDREFARSDGFRLDGCTLVGEYMRGTQWAQHQERKGLFYVYDILRVFGEPITNESYSARYRILRKLVLPSVYRLVDCYRIQDYESIWQRYVLREGYEGVVFRRAASTIHDAIMRCKREYSFDGTVVGYETGKGKYEGQLGAYKVIMENNTTTLVGGGYTDAERAVDPTTNIGRVMEFTANAIFESGNVRHPRFIRWRDDKTL